MAAYEYDEGGVMATYFLITFLALILVPFTLSSFGGAPDKITHGCDCDACVEQRTRAKNLEGSLLAPRLSKKAYALAIGWAIFALAVYRASKMKGTSSVYDPFEILGIASSASEKEIKSHFKKLSRMYHPDKVKETAELTIEAIQDRFVSITKAYKSLTDETIRKNWLEWNNPDGPQTTSMGIALPPWIVESKNNVWVLGVYGLLFGGALPLLVGRWWFGNRQKTKDGINARSAAAFFKSITEEATTEEVVSALGKAYEWELPTPKKNTQALDAELDELDKTISQKVGQQYAEVKRLAKDANGDLHESRRRALILIYAHLTRLPIQSPALQTEQRQVILQTPLLLNALLNVSTARNWLVPTLSVMRLNSYLAQALPLNAPPRVRLTQLPGVSKADIDALTPRPREMTEVLSALQEKGDARAGQVQKAIQKWGRVEIVDAVFKVIGERIITPSSIIFLVVKLRLVPPGTSTEKKDLSVDETKRVAAANEKKDEEFLLTKGDAEDVPKGKTTTGWAHAPRWPTARKPTWWLVLGDEKQGRVVVPPIRISDIPYADSESERDYRTYKIQFQGPPSTGVFTWKVFVVSDTYVAEEANRDITLKIEDAVVDGEPSEDEISEPDEDSLAGQMAAMRGGQVKKKGEESEEESGTDDDEEDSDSSSDSDSD
ncbi:translocation protein sec63 [Ephemerocybe angulata]|uniref:Translocation protein sec63 n=1 Tax=Ephemerocybe angulata TaxID=980116 RepID=A0A8H6H9U2_9AGAR|nr:translocation protein sec63 [Tulosesus angulatus]